MCVLVSFPIANKKEEKKRIMKGSQIKCNRMKNSDDLSDTHYINTSTLALLRPAIRRCTTNLLAV
jgi:hypothetical protein